MTLAPLLAAPWTTQVHAGAASIALLSGACVIAARKGTPTHVGIGRVFAAAMMLTAAISFAVTGLRPGHFSPIHILSVVTLTTIPLAIARRRAGDIRGHAIAMGANFAGLVAAGLFTLAPSRILGQVFNTGAFLGF